MNRLLNSFLTTIVIIVVAVIITTVILGLSMLMFVYPLIGIPVVILIIFGCIWRGIYLDTKS